MRVLEKVLVEFKEYMPCETVFRSDIEHDNFWRVVERDSVLTLYETIDGRYAVNIYHGDDSGEIEIYG